MNSIKALSDLATSESNTYLSTSSSGAVADTSGNPAKVLVSQKVTKFIQDTTSPSLDSFDFYLATGLLVLSFSETVDPETFSAKQLTLQSSTAYAVDSLPISGGDFTNTVGPVINLTLTLKDLNELKETEGFATAKGNTFIALTEFAVNDTAGNRVDEVYTDDAIQVDLFISDAEQPILEGYTLDLNTGRITLTFLRKY